MPLNVSLETPSCECCSLYHDVPSLKKIEVQREGKTKKVGFVAMEQHFFCHIKSSDKSNPVIQDKSILFDVLIQQWTSTSKKISFFTPLQDCFCALQRSLKCPR